MSKCVDYTCYRRIMMRILKPGKKIIHFMKVTCIKCLAELEINSNDLTKVPSARSVDPRTYEYKCIGCCHYNYLFAKDLTEEIHFDLEKMA